MTSSAECERPAETGSCRHVEDVKMLCALSVARRETSVTALGGTLAAVDDVKRRCLAECGERSAYRVQAAELEARLRQRRRVAPARKGLAAWLRELFG